MREKDLKFNKRPNFKLPKYNTKEYFISNYGYKNCRILKFKSYHEVINILKSNLMGAEFSSEEKQFLVKNSHKEVLCYINHYPNEGDDVFVFGNNDIPFSLDCFV